MQREQKLIERLAELSTQRAGLTKESSEAVIEGDAQAINSARLSLARVDSEIAQLSQAMALAKQRDREEAEAKVSANGLAAAARALPIARKRKALAQKVDSTILQLVRDLQELHSLGVELSSDGSTVAHAVGANRAAFDAALPAGVFAKQFVALKVFNEPPFIGASDLQASNLPWVGFGPWSSGAVAELEGILERHAPAKAA